MSVDFSQIETTPLIPVAQPTVPGRRIHIDADMLAYQCGGGEDTDVLTSRRILTSKINLFVEAAGAEQVRLHMTASGSTKGDRAVVAVTKPYQGQRKGHKPKNWGYLRDYMADGCAGAIKQWLDREADDGFGFVSVAEPGAVICSRDKDMRMLEGWHLNWDLLELVFVPPGAYCVEACGEIYGYKWFLSQMLQGDSADNIPGLTHHAKYKAGVGKAAAGKILAGTTTGEEGIEQVIKHYRETHGDKWADSFTEQAMLLWIRRGRLGLLDDWIEYLPVVSTKDELAITVAMTRHLERVRLMKAEAACLSD